MWARTIIFSHYHSIAYHNSQPDFHSVAHHNPQPDFYTITHHNPQPDFYTSATERLDKPWT